MSNKTFGSKVGQPPADKSESGTSRKARLVRKLKARGFDLTSGVRGSDTVYVRCSRCEALVINGIAAHERGCPNSRKRDR